MFEAANTIYSSFILFFSFFFGQSYIILFVCLCCCCFGHNENYLKLFDCLFWLTLSLLKVFTFEI